MEYIERIFIEKLIHPISKNFMTLTDRKVVVDRHT